MFWALVIRTFWNSQPQTTGTDCRMSDGADGSDGAPRWMDPDGTRRTPMDPDRPGWTPMDPTDPTGPDGPRCTMDPDGPRRTDPDGPQRTPTDPHGPPWTSTDHEKLAGK